MSWLEEFKAALEQQHADSAAALLLRNLEAGNYPENELRAASEIMAEEYKKLHAAPVLAVLHKLEAGLQAPHYQALIFALQPELEATRTWAGRLDEIGGERLVNGLVLHIKNKDMAGAEGAVANLMSSVPEEFRSKRAALIGHILGSLVHERERAAAFVKQMSHFPTKYGLDALVVTDLEEAYAKGAADVARRETMVSGAARQQHTEAVVELSRLLPARNALSEPTAEEIDKFAIAMRAIARCCILSPAFDRFHEALPLFVEFSAKEVSTAGALAGVEQRLFPELGRTAREVASRVLKDVGANPSFSHPMIHFIQHHMEERIGRVGIEALGIMQSAAGLPLTLTALQNAKMGAHGEAVFALGSIGSEQALAALQKQLLHDLKGTVVTGDARRDAFNVISAYGRAVRSVRDPAQRSRLIIPVIKLLPKEDLEFLVRAVLNFFTGKQDEMDPALLRWAAQVAVTALWSSDRPELARAGANQVLGFRKPLIDLLGRLAPQVLPAINAEILKHSKTYNAAYLAVGEFYAQHPDPSEVEVIRQLLFNLNLHDDSGKNAYQKETLLDTTTDQRTELTKDRVIASLAFALDKIDTAEASAMLAELYDQVRAGTLPPPGPETSEILMKAREKTLKGGTLGIAPAASGSSPFDDFPFPSSDVDNSAVGQNDPLRAPSAPVSSSPQASLATVDVLIKDLTAKYLMSGKRREKKVAAMAQLAQLRAPQAAGIMAQHLTDPDAMIAMAAESAMLAYLQKEDAATKGAARAIMDSIISGDNPQRVKSAALLKKIGMEHPVTVQITQSLQSRELSREAKAVVDSLTRQTSVSPHEVVIADKEKLGAMAQYLPAKTAANSTAPGLTSMDLKRAYMQARQEWIKGGKNGPEPKPPGSESADGQPQE